MASADDVGKGEAEWSDGHGIKRWVEETEVRLTPPFFCV
jgi:hypothetical protein